MVLNATRTTTTRRDAKVKAKANATTHELAADTGVDIDESIRDRVVDATDRLVYDRGVRAVGMDAIRDASGVSLKTLYRLFPTKDQLVGAALRRRDERLRLALARHVRDVAEPDDKILAVFDHLHDWFREDDFHGCPFINSYAETRSTPGPVTAAVEAQKDALRAFIDDLVAAAGRAPALAAQVFILAHGAMVAAAISGDPAAAVHAKDAARTLLAAAPRVA